ncbi:MAG: glutamyl-tRNA reductase, partial [Deltaproteobacteria bacterium]|nr:glutamyl-tRNA reductase [Deltaproteobacteria bacterium]
QMADALATADVVITSTGSSEPLITYAQMKTVMRRRRSRPIFLIDIAIPRDVEPHVNDLDGVYLYNIDDLQAVVQENLGERRQEALRGDAIVNQEAAKFMEWTRTLDTAPTIVALKEKLDAVRIGELAKADGKLSRLTPEDREMVDVITRSIVNKIAHDPISFLKRTASRSKGNVYLDLAQRMFRLDGLSSDSETKEEDLES